MAGEAPCTWFAASWWWTDSVHSAVPAMKAIAPAPAPESPKINGIRDGGGGVGSRGFGGAGGLTSSLASPICPLVTTTH